MRLAIDIDETLAQTNLLWAQHHIAAYGNPERLSPEDIIKKYRFVKDVPYWQLDDAHKWVEAHIQSNDAKLEIPVIEEAIDVMHKIPVECYLTNRPETTIDGTRNWLRKYNFPERAIISSSDGLVWKANMIAEMFPNVTGIVDDNIDLLSELPRDYKGKIFLYSHQDCNISELNVILCPTWRDVEKAVNQLK